MSKIIDQIVKISIQDSISSVSTTDVNTMAIVGKTGASGSAAAGSYASADAVGTAYGEDSELYAMALKFFAQDSQPNSLVCIPATSFSDALAAVQTAAATLEFYHVCAATDDTATTDTVLKAWQDWLAEAKKVLHVQIYEATPYTESIALMASLKAYGADRVAVYLHKENRSVTSINEKEYETGDSASDTSTYSGGVKTQIVVELSPSDNPTTTTTTTTVTSFEFLNVAIVALRCAADSARGTFAHKKCSSVTADSYTSTTYASLIAAGLNLYLTVSGEARLFMGSTCDNESFIDQVVKDDWIRFNVQSKIFTLLGEANDGHGVNYEDAGIASVAASIGNVFANASDTDHQYIMDGYSVSYKDYAYLKENNASDIRARNLPLVSGSYARMNSIHTVVQVSLQVTL